MSIDLAGKDRVGCNAEGDEWKCLSFGKDSALNLVYSGGATLEHLFKLLPPVGDLADAHKVTGRAARCGEIQPSAELLLAITLFAGTDVNRGAEDIAPTSLCVDDETGLLLSLRAPVPGSDNAVEITTSEARSATEQDFIPPAVVQPAPHVGIDDIEIDEDCCDGS